MRCNAAMTMPAILAAREGLPQPGPESPDRPRVPHEPGPPPLALLLVALTLVVGGYLLSVKLRDLGRMQDCLMQGRTNCAPMEEAGR